MERPHPETDPDGFETMESAPEELLVLFEKLKKQYPFSQEVLERYDLAPEGMPAWSDIETALTREALRKILMLNKPELYVFPDKQVQWAFHKKHRDDQGRPTLRCEDNEAQRDEPLWRDIDRRDPYWDRSYHPDPGKWRTVVAESEANKKNIDRKILWKIPYIYTDVPKELQYYLQNGLDVMSDLPLYVAFLMHHCVRYGGLGGYDENVRRIKEPEPVILNGKRINPESAGKALPIVGTSGIEPDSWRIGSVTTPSAWEYASLRGILELQQPEKKLSSR